MIPDWETNCVYFSRLLPGRYSRVDSAYGKRLRGILAKECLRIEKIPHFQEDWEEDGIPSAVGNYVNYLRVGRLIVVPAYKARQDDRACKTLEALCPGTTVVPLLCKDLARAGGVLNCISWTIRSKPKWTMRSN